MENIERGLPEAAPTDSAKKPRGTVLEGLCVTERLLLNALLYRYDNSSDSLTSNFQTGWHSKKPTMQAPLSMVRLLHQAGVFSTICQAFEFVENLVESNMTEGEEPDSRILVSQESTQQHRGPTNFKKTIDLLAHRCQSSRFIST